MVAIWYMLGALTVGSAGPHLVNGLGGLDHVVLVKVASTAVVAESSKASTPPSGAGSGPGPHPRSAGGQHLSGVDAAYAKAVAQVPGWRAIRRSTTFRS